MPDNQIIKLYVDWCSKNNLYILIHKDLTNKFFIPPSCIGLIKSETSDSRVCPLGVIGLLEVSLGSHGSFQILILLPFPILYTIPAFKTSTPFKCSSRYMTFAAGKACSRSPSRKYLILELGHTKRSDCGLVSTLALLTSPY
jgi:hypothetical protein